MYAYHEETFGSLQMHVEKPGSAKRASSHTLSTCDVSGQRGDVVDSHVLSSVHGVPSSPISKSSLTLTEKEKASERASEREKKKIIISK